MQSLTAVKMPQQTRIFDKSCELSCDNTVKKHKLKHLRFVNHTDIGKWPDPYKRFALANTFKHNKVLNIHLFSSNTLKACCTLDNPQTPHKNNTHPSPRDTTQYTISVICQLGIPGQLNQNNNK